MSGGDEGTSLGSRVRVEVVMGIALHRLESEHKLLIRTLSLIYAFLAGSSFTLAH
jgi:hypothetical protein